MSWNTLFVSLDFCPSLKFRPPAKQTSDVAWCCLRDHCHIVGVSRWGMVAKVLEGACLRREADARLRR